MRSDANRIALRAVRHILGGARNLTLDIAGTPVTASTTRASDTPWPPKNVERLDQAADGPWPDHADVECRWEGGQVALRVMCDYSRTYGRYRHNVGIRIRLRDRPNTLVWITVPLAIADKDDGSTAKLHASISTVKRRAVVWVARRQS